MTKITVILFLAVTLILSGCQILPFQNLPTGRTAPAGATELPVQASPLAPSETSASENVAPGQASDATEEIINALLALAEQDSFRVDQTISAPDVNMVNEIEIIPPDRFRMVNSEMEMIIIEENAYINVAGQWMSVPGSGETIIGAYVFLKDQADAELFRSYVPEASYQGEVDLGGETARLYEFLLSDPSESGLANVQLWVDASDGLPRRQELTLSDYDDSGEEATIVNIYKDFNEPITIEAPEE